MPQYIRLVEPTCFTIYALYIIIKSFAIFHLSRHDAIFVIMKYEPLWLQDITINPDNIFNTECEQEYSLLCFAHCAVGLINGYLDMGSKQKQHIKSIAPLSEGN